MAAVQEWSEINRAFSPRYHRIEHLTHSLDWPYPHLSLSAHQTLAPLYMSCSRVPQSHLAQRSSKEKSSYQKPSKARFASPPTPLETPKLRIRKKIYPNGWQAFSERPLRSLIIRGFMSIGVLFVAVFVVMVIIVVIIIVILLQHNFP